ncbi:MAG: TolC family protein [Desulfobacterales bacterium]|nr:TolC family protein [Desulfobacterales bacterium]
MSKVCRLISVCMLGILSASCNLWPGELGQVDLPYEPQEARRIEQQSIEEESESAPKSIEESLKSIRERVPSAKDEAPQAVRELESGLEPLTVAEMRALVLENNLDLDVALLDPDIARLQISAEEGRFDAVIGSRFAFRRVETPRLNQNLVDFTSDDPVLDGAEVKPTEIGQTRDELDFDLGVRLPLPTGGEIAVKGLLDRKRTLDPKNFSQYLAGTRFSLSQPLLRDAGRNASFASIRLARVDQRISEVRTKLAAMRILARAEKAYWRLFAARKLLDVRAEQFRLAQESLDLVYRRVEQGLTARVEIARTEVGLYQRVEALIVAEVEWRLRQRDLKVFLATKRFPLRGERMIDVTTEPLLAGLDLDADALIQRALDERLELIEVELGIVRDGIEIAFRENQVLPIVNLDFEYGTLSRDDSLDNAWTSQWDFDNPDLSVGIRFEIPFTNQRRLAQRDTALLAKSQRLATQRARELMVREEVFDMLDIIDRNWQRIVAARQNVIVAGVNYDAELRQFEQGLRTMREVFEALSDLGDAQIREIGAIVDYQIAQIDLAFATGTLLGYSRVSLAPLEIPVN